MKYIYENYNKNKKIIIIYLLILIILSIVYLGIIFLLFAKPSLLFSIGLVINSFISLIIFLIIKENISPLLNNYKFAKKINATTFEKINVKIIEIDEKIITLRGQKFISFKIFNLNNKQENILYLLHNIKKFKKDENYTLLISNNFITGYEVKKHE